MVGGGGISNWGSDDEELDECLASRPECKKHFGRTCPFCKMTTTWEMDNIPRANMDTRRWAISAPDVVINGKHVL